ncbi:MAG: hypothetical protein COA67_00705 [Lutibacter sp.]|nr:MAG: hypothetical protein COA67_00705 [Lutibacter sp.]
MKKLFLAVIVIAFGFTANAQDGKCQGNFGIGVSAGLPTGDVSDAYTFSLGLDVNYLFEVSETFDVGPSVSYLTFFGGEISGFDIDNASFLPISAAARVYVGDSFAIGADIGYALGLSPDDNDGGFYYAPRIQYGVSDDIDIVAAYTGISVDGGSFNSINLGVNFGL